MYMKRNISMLSIQEYTAKRKSIYTRTDRMSLKVNFLRHLNCPTMLLAMHAKLNENSHDKKG